jgi:hypothetical protein
MQGMYDQICSEKASLGGKVIMSGKSVKDGRLNGHGKWGGERGFGMKSRILFIVTMA